MSPARPQSPAWTKCHQTSRRVPDPDFGSISIEDFLYFFSPFFLLSLLFLSHKNCLKKYDQFFRAKIFMHQNSFQLLILSYVKTQYFETLVTVDAHSKYLKYQSKFC